MNYNINNDLVTVSGGNEYNEYSGSGKGPIIAVIIVVVVLLAAVVGYMLTKKDATVAVPVTPVVAPPKYTAIGCFTDGNPRTLSIRNNTGAIEPNATTSNVEKCAQWAKSLGNKVFGVQYGGECWTDSDTATATPATSYAKLGGVACAPRTGYPEGTGNNWVNHVYQWDKLV